MRRHLFPLLGLLLTFTFGLAALPGASYAASTPTPNGYVGGWNMLQDPTMLPGAGGAMDHANGNGNAATLSLR